ncbi:hypothetical protein WJX73_002745 [Symbiochloris irregularis]|uniref:CREG-like beta-barrel domain-containing protein n=1 Tax=Symbiochloris irregularis TaxID=706552 RepID=A0AAW1NKW9_9CHLO
MDSYSSYRASSQLPRAVVLGLMVLLATHDTVSATLGHRRLFGGPNFVVEDLSPRPPHVETARMTRWLVHANDWGTLSTISVKHHGVPFGNTASYSDGAMSHSTGRLLFYLTLMDATAQDAAANPNVTLSIAEAQLPGSCGTTDPEDPTCAKVSITGQLKPVEAGEKLKEAKEILFQRHPQMAKWPVGHHFTVYELHIEYIQLLDYYGGAIDVPVPEYFAAELSTPWQMTSGTCLQSPWRPLCLIDKMFSA